MKLAIQPTDLKYIGWNLGCGLSSFVISAGLAYTINWISHKLLKAEPVIVDIKGDPNAEFKRLLPSLKIAAPAAILSTLVSGLSTLVSAYLIRKNLLISFTTRKNFELLCVSVALTALAARIPSVKTLGNISVICFVGGLMGQAKLSSLVLCWLFGAVKGALSLHEPKK